MAMEFTVYTLIVIYIFYGLLIVPYFSSKILSQHYGKRRLWFYIIAFLNLFSLEFILSQKEYRKDLLFAEKVKLILFILGYFIYSYIIVNCKNIKVEENRKKHGVRPTHLTKLSRVFWPLY